MEHIFIMKDGRKVILNHLDIKTILKIKKKDWKEIKRITSEALEFVKSPQYMINLRNNFILDGKK